MESVLRRSQAICPLLRVEFGLIHIPAISVLGFLRICAPDQGAYLQDTAMSGNALLKNAHTSLGPQTFHRAKPSTLAGRALSGGVQNETLSPYGRAYA